MSRRGGGILNASEPFVDVATALMIGPVGPNIFAVGILHGGMYGQSGNHLPQRGEVVLDFLIVRDGEFNSAEQGLRNAT